MSTSDQERAREAVEAALVSEHTGIQWVISDGLRQSLTNRFVEALAATRREAERAGYERACRVIEHYRLAQRNGPVRSMLGEIQDRIRALKWETDHAE